MILRSQARRPGRSEATAKAPGLLSPNPPPQMPEGLGSVLISFVVQTSGVVGLEVGFDDLFLYRARIFADGVHITQPPLIPPR